MKEYSTIIDLGADLNEKNSKWFYLNRTDDCRRDHRYSRGDSDPAIPELGGQSAGQ